MLALNFKHNLQDLILSKRNLLNQALIEFQESVLPFFFYFELS
jgi:hypothetical protein